MNRAGHSKCLSEGVGRKELRWDREREDEGVEGGKRELEVIGREDDNGLRFISHTGFFVLYSLMIESSTNERTNP